MPLAGCKQMTRILVAEFLLANAAASRDVATSMLNEAAAMLTAIVTDIAALPNVHVTVLLSSATDASFAASLTNTHVLLGELQPDILSSILHGKSRRSVFDGVLLIAPECDGVLVSLLKAVQEKHKNPPWSINLDWRLAEIFADKRATDAWLRRHDIATIPTKTINDATMRRLRRTAPATGHNIADQLAVLKPRDGAGSDGVEVVLFCQVDFMDLPQQEHDDDRWLLQPLMQGTTCSVGFIGGGPKGRTIILPPARQNIITVDRKLSYHGGQIPCQPEIVARVEPVAAKLADAFGTFSGYVGADLLVDLTVPHNDETSIVVVEINPRLCTSYIGYRTFAADNLAAWMLQTNSETNIRWKSENVIFSPG